MYDVGSMDEVDPFTRGKDMLVQMESSLLDEVQAGAA